MPVTRTSFGRVRRVKPLKVDYFGSTIKWPTGHPIYEGSIVEAGGIRFKVEGPLVDKDGVTTALLGPTQ